MTRLRSLAPLAVLAAASLAVVACDSGSKPAAPTGGQQQAPPAKAGVPALTSEQMTAIKKVFDEARVWVKQADDFKARGEEMERSDGLQAAIPLYQEAKPLYRQASQHVEEWVDPDFGKITAAQRDAYLGPELHELHKWQQAYAAMGKIPPKE